MNTHTESQLEELRDEMRKIKYDLKTFPLGHLSYKALENEIERREILIQKITKMFG
jgi:uncharacterized coiled-coil DUF342 family protein